MRIAWVTPLARGSGISKYSLAVVPALARLVDLEVWAPVTGDDYPCPAAPVHNLVADEATEDALQAYDHVVFSAGNNPAFHTEIHRLSERVSGIVVVHDKRMSGFFHDLWAVHGRDPARYAAMMRYYYGRPGEEAAREILAGRAGVDTYDAFPLVEPALWNATGIVVHSVEAAGIVGRYGESVPVATLGLPFDPSAMREAASMPSREQLVAGDERVLLVSSGGVFEQKRLDSVIRAIAAEPRLRDVALLAIVGGGRDSYLDALARLATDLGIADSVRITGRVDDATMYGWIAAADIAVNLRYPSMESSSLSLVEQMYLGVPVVVTDTSYYSELPADVALKVPVATEADDLRRALITLVEDGALRARMGAAAADYARRRHDPVAYARRIAEFAVNVRARRGESS